MAAKLKPLQFHHVGERCAVEYPFNKNDYEFHSLQPHPLRVAIVQVITQFSDEMFVIRRIQ